MVNNLDNASEVALTRFKEFAGDQGSNLAFHKMWALVRRFDQPQRYKPFVSRE